MIVPISDAALAAAVAAAEDVVVVETDVGSHILGYLMNLEEVVEVAVRTYLAALKNGINA